MEREKPLRNPLQTLDIPSVAVGPAANSADQHEGIGIPLVATEESFRDSGVPQFDGVVERASASPTVGRWGCEWPS